MKSKSGKARPPSTASAPEKTDTVTVSPDQAVVNEITRLHDEILAAARTSLEKALRIGELLTGIKTRLQHGEWLPWVAAGLPFTDRTARNYIRVYDNRDRLKSETVSNLTEAYQLLTARARPDDLLCDLPDAETLAGDISETGQKRFETFYAKTMLQIECGMERLQSAQNIAAVLQCKRDADSLLQFWREITLESERCLGGCLLEIEARKTESP